MTESLQYRLHALRDFLEPQWQAAHESWGDSPSCLSLHMCRYTALFLEAVVQGAEIQAGRGKGAGFCDADGRWQDHAWCRVGDCLVDLTADQFGAKGVIITTLDDPRYWAHLTRDEISEQFSSLKKRVVPWIRDYRKYLIPTKVGIHF